MLKSGLRYSLIWMCAASSNSHRLWKEVEAGNSRHASECVPLPLFFHLLLAAPDKRHILVRILTPEMKTVDKSLQSINRLASESTSAPQIGVASGVRKSKCLIESEVLGALRGGRFSEIGVRGSLFLNAIQA